MHTSTNIIFQKIRNRRALILAFFQGKLELCDGGDAVTLCSLRQLKNLMEHH